MSLFQRHCSDELLLAWLDGELVSRQKRSVSGHLNACWHCRSRLDELEQQALAVARALTNPDWPGPDRLASAKARMRAGRVAFERKASRALLPASRTHRAAAPAILALAALALVTLFRPRQLDLPSAGEVLLQARRTEATAAPGTEPLIQQFAVEVEELYPAGPVRRGSVTIWSDPGHDRFASRWMDSNGGLKHAVWRAGESREWIFDAHQSKMALSRQDDTAERPTLWEAVRSEASVGSLEEAVRLWLLRRDWQPILLTREFAALVSNDSAILRLERVEDPERGVYRMIASRSEGGRHVDLILEVDARTYVPRLKSIRFTANGRVAQIRIIPEQARRIDAGELRPAIFMPDSSLLPPLQHGPRTPSLARIEPRRPVVMPAVPSEADLATDEIEVRYAIHRARACLGEPVTVDRQPRNIVVHGIVETQQRKQALLAALSDGTAGRSVTVNIETVDDQLAKQLDARLSAPVTSADRDSVGMRLVALHPPLEPMIKRYLGQAAGSPTPGRNEAAGFSAKLVAASRGLMLEAWALRRLAESFGPSRIAALPPHSRWLLEVMTQDHLRSLTGDSSKLLHLLQPLERLDGGGGTAGFASRPAAVATEMKPDASWQDGGRHLFEAMRHLDDRLNALFVATRLETGTTVDPSEVSSEDAERSLVELLNDLRDIQKTSTAMRTSVAEQLSKHGASANPAAHGTSPLQGIK